MDTDKTYRPCIDINCVRQFIETNSGFKICHVEELEAYEDRNYCFIIEHNSDQEANHLKAKSIKLIVKVIKYSEKCLRKWQTLKTIMAYLQKNGFISTQILSIPDNLLKNEGRLFQILILKYIHGIPLMKCWSHLDENDVVTKSGQMVANLHNTLQELEVSMLDEEKDPEDPWKLDNAMCMLNYIDVIKDKDEQKILRSIIETFSKSLEETKKYLTKGIIHGDLHDMNLIVNCKDGQLRQIEDCSRTSMGVKKLFGIIDFGDMCISYYIAEVAQIIRDFMVSANPENCFTVAAHFLTGYLEHRKLNLYELDILFITIMAALCQYYVIGEYEFQRQPDNVYSKAGSIEAAQLIRMYHDCHQTFKSNLTDFLQENNIELMNLDI